MGISHHEENKERRDQEIDECGNDLAIQNSPIGQFFDIGNSESLEDRLKDEGRYEIIDQSLDQRPYLGGDKQSDSYSEDIVLSEESHEIFEHRQRSEDKTNGMISI